MKLPALRAAARTSDSALRPVNTGVQLLQEGAHALGIIGRQARLALEFALEVELDAQSLAKSGRHCANGLATSRAQSTKSCATGLTVLFFRAIIATANGWIGSATGNFYRKAVRIEEIQERVGHYSHEATTFEHSNDHLGGKNARHS